MEVPHRQYDRIRSISLSGAAAKPPFTLRDDGRPGRGPAVVARW